MCLGPMNAVAPRSGTFGSFAARPQGLRASIAAFRRSMAISGIKAMLVAGRHVMAFDSGAPLS